LRGGGGGWGDVEIIDDRLASNPMGVTILLLMKDEMFGLTIFGQKIWILIL